MNGAGAPGQEGAAARSGPVRLAVRAPAKVNLVLAVGGVRGDGFHPVVSVLQCIDLFDELVLELEVGSDGGAVDVTTEAPGVPGGDSLVAGAIDGFARAAGIGVRARVTIDKRIPVGAGLGGGSSDAAAALRAMSVAAPGRVDAATLLRLAGELGSDVPSFLAPSGRSLAQGRGELVTPLPVAASAMPVAVLASTGEHASTPAVYRAFDDLAGDRALPSAGDVVDAADAGRWRNDLDAAARIVSPGMAAACDELAARGVVTLVCGSGSAFLAFVGSRSTREVVDLMRATGAGLAQVVAATSLPDVVWVD